YLAHFGGCAGPRSEQVVKGFKPKKLRRKPKPIDFRSALAVLPETRPRRPRAGAWHRPKSPASTAWTFSLAISGECELDCSGTIDARFCARRTPGGVKSVNLYELSVPGTEARPR